MLMSQSITSLFVFTEPFPLQIALIAIFAGVILVLLVTILVILFRKRICCSNRDDKDGDKTSGTSTGNCFPYLKSISRKISSQSNNEFLQNLQHWQIT